MLIIPHNLEYEHLSIIQVNGEQILSIITDIEQQKNLPFITFLDVDRLENKNVEVLKYIVENWDNAIPLPIWCEIKGLTPIVTDCWKRINLRSVERIVTNYKQERRHKPKVRRKKIASTV